MVFKKSKDRKQQRYTNILSKTFNIHLLNEPSNILSICNGGLANGLTQELLLQHFSPFGDISLALLPPCHSISFLQFDSVESAISGYKSSNQLYWPGGGPAFLAYVDRLPDHEKTDHLFQSPPGLIVLYDFITEEEEIQFLDCISLKSSSCNLKNRVVKHFGYEFKYDDNRADSSPIEPIPKAFDVLWTRLMEVNGLHFTPDQCTVNRYEPGDGIPPHADTHSAFTDAIISLSMQSDIVMDWRKEGTLRHVLLPRRSLCIMTGESRYGWTHGITPRKSDVVPGWRGGLTLLPRLVRTSVTFRTRQESDCSCSYPELCDTALRRLKEQANAAQDMEDSKAAHFEDTCVHKVYEEIADHFSETRHKPWPNVVKFLNWFPAGALILDIGCGNGKYLSCRPDTALLGCDRSRSLAQLCKDRGFPVFTCDCLNVPIRDNSIDGCISIAVLHHLSTQERRLKGIQELVRVLRPSGRALIYVWAKNQQVNALKSSYLKQRKEKAEHFDDGEPSLGSAGDVVLPIHKNRTNFQSSDMFVPWQKKPTTCTESGSTFLRYYHVFEDTELREMCENIVGVNCVDYYYDQGNWCIILEKCDN